jgi:hypothetical protein
VTGHLLFRQPDVTEQRNNVFIRVSQNKILSTELFGDSQVKKASYLNKVVQ